ncbi:putative cobalamin biosynthesis protein CobD [Leptospira kirschneri str. 200801925]|nr:putative cobalamin biosynthesis protein CobD [Leptospira kirschneri str. 200801925]
MPWNVAVSVLVDLILGDPKNFPHPVRAIGKLARVLEKFFRNNCSSEEVAGILTSCLVYLISFIIPFLFVQLANQLHWILGELLTVMIVYTTIAIRDMIDHSKEVYDALVQTDLSLARKKVSRIVARDTESLSESEIIRACVESTAENLVDGITAPLFYAISGGPAWALLYRSINTLDSLFGYKNKKYLRFGNFPARMDDFSKLFTCKNYILYTLYLHLCF